MYGSVVKDVQMNPAHPHYRQAVGKKLERLCSFAYVVEGGVFG